MEMKMNLVLLLLHLTMLCSFLLTPMMMVQNAIAIADETELLVSPFPEEEEEELLPSEDMVEWAESKADDKQEVLVLKLMHRDSPLSPLKKQSNDHKQEKKPEEVFVDRLQRDENRVKQINGRVRRATRRETKGAHPHEAETIGTHPYEAETIGTMPYRETIGGDHPPQIPPVGTLPYAETMGYEETIKAHAIGTPSYEDQKPIPRGSAHRSFDGPLMSGLNDGSGEYFTRLGVGTPPKQAFMVVDTGSDIIWIQCEPCIDCYTQRGPIFNPSTSRTFRKLPCTSPTCALLELHGCEAKTNLCLYQVAYGDGSFTQGEFSSEALSFKEATIRNVAIGCGHDNEGLFAGASGLFGLGGGGLSFISQVGRVYKKIFSYCLMDRDKEGLSTLTFGGLPSGVNKFTSLLRNPNLDTFYYVGLSGISVGGMLLHTIPATAFQMDSVNGDGGVIVDSGTSVTRLVEVAYGPLRSAFRAATHTLPFVGGFSLFDTCFDLSGRTRVTLPTLSLHFEGGAFMDLPPTNYLVPVNTKGTYCFAFASTSGQLSIIGNIQQQGFRIVFDVASARFGFAPNSC